MHAARLRIGGGGHADAGEEPAHDIGVAADGLRRPGRTGAERGQQGGRADGAVLGLLDMTVFGRQEDWADSPAGWPQGFRTNGDQFRVDGRPASQWSRLAAGRDDDLGATGSAHGGAALPLRSGQGSWSSARVSRSGT